MTEKTCCVTGHRDIPDEQIDAVKYALRREIVKAVSDGYTGFMTGFADGADQYFAEMVVKLQEDFPDLRLIAVLPYRKRIASLESKEQTKVLLHACADVIVIQEEYKPNVYSKRNRYMVEHSDRVIAVYDGREKGGTVNTIRFTHALKKELREIPVGEIHLPNPQN